MDASNCFYELHKLLGCGGNGMGWRMPGIRQRQYSYATYLLLHSKSGTDPLKPVVLPASKEGSHLGRCRIEAQ